MLASGFCFQSLVCDWVFAPFSLSGLIAPAAMLYISPAALNLVEHLRLQSCDMGVDIGEACVHVWMIPSTSSGFCLKRDVSLGVISSGEPRAGVLPRDLLP